MRRAEVWTADLNPTRGPEVGKVRPVLVIQADWLTEAGADTILMVPLSTQHRPSLEPLRVPIPARDRLKKPCTPLPEKARALDRARFGEGPLTTLTETEMAAVERALRAVMGMAVEEH